MLARVRSYDDDIRAAVELLEAAVAEAEGEPLVQGRAHEILSGIFFRLRERLVESVEHARAALAIARELDDAELAAAALGSLVLAEAALGSEEAPATLAAADARRLLGSRNSGDGWRRVPGRRRADVVGPARRSEGVVRADARRRRSDRATRARCPTSGCCSHRRNACVADSTTAAAHADEGALRAEQVGQETLVAYALALRALADAHRGDEDATRSAAAQALALAGSHERPAGRALCDGRARAARALARTQHRGCRRPHSPRRLRKAAGAARTG